MKVAGAVSLLVLAALLAPAGLRAEEAEASAESEESTASDGGADGTDGDATEVIIRAPRPPGRDPTQADVEVDGQRLRDSPRPSTLEALSQEVAGMYLPARGALHGVANGATGGISIRGLGGSPNSQVLVVEDGVPDRMGIFGHPIPDAYAPFLLEDAVVLPGGDSVLYGTNAMGGVVVLRNRWLEREGFALTADSAIGSYSTLRESAALLGRSGRWALAAAVLGFSSDGHREGAGGDELVGHFAVRADLVPGLRLSLRNKTVHLAGADPGPASHPNPDHWFDVWRNNTALQLQWDGPGLDVTVTPFFNFGIHRLYDGFRSLDTVGGGIAEAELVLAGTARLLLGLAAQHVDGEVENRISGERPGVEGMTDISAYSQLSFRPVEPLAVVLGVRVLHSLTYGLVPLYKGGLRWEIGHGLYAHTRIARNFRQPTLRELYLPYPTANPDLRPETSLNWDFGLGYESEHFELSCVGYRTAADDLIRYFGVWPAAEVVNIDHIAIWGVEGRLAARHLGPVTLTVTGDWQDVGRYTRQNPDAKLDFTLEAGHQFAAHSIAGSLTGEWVHGLYMSNYGRDPLADVFSMDLALRYRYSAPGWALEPYLFLRNFLDRRYAYVEGYPMPGFNLLAGLKLEL